MNGIKDGVLRLKGTGLVRALQEIARAPRVLFRIKSEQLAPYAYVCNLKMEI